MEKISENSMFRTLARAISADLDRMRQRFRLRVEDAEDIEQRTWMRFLRSRARIANPVPWLIHVFRNECLRFLSKRKQSPEPIPLSEDLPSDYVGEEIVLVDLIELQLKKLSVEAKRLLWQRYVLGMTPREIAAERGQTPATVSKALYRALRSARTQADNNPDCP